MKKLHRKFIDAIESSGGFSPSDLPQSGTSGGRLHGIWARGRNTHGAFMSSDDMLSSPAAPVQPSMSGEEAVFSLLSLQSRDQDDSGSGAVVQVPHPKGLYLHAMQFHLVLICSLHCV